MFKRETASKGKDEMITTTPSQDLECWSGTSYGYHRIPAIPPPVSDINFEPTEVERAINRIQQYLLKIQNQEQGYWVGELEANTTLTSEYIFFMHFMGILDELRQKKIVAYLKQTQLPDGSWNIYFGGPGDLSTTIEAYWAMKLAGEAPDSETMTKARDFILIHGGIEQSRVFTKIFLALTGVYPWENCPALPPELMLLPKNFPLNIFEMSSWARATVVPLVIMWHYRPVIGSQTFSLDELNLSDSVPATTNSPPPFGWEQVFYAVDKTLKYYEKRPFATLRKKALKQAEDWILARQDPTGEWGGIMPAMMNSLMALKCLGYPLTHPAVRKGIEAVHRFAIDEGKTLRLQSSVSPVWDTANTCLALTESAMPPDHPAITKAADWLWKKQIKKPGDWAEKNPDTPPAGWAFEFENCFYPDTDDTLAVLTLLKHTSLTPQKNQAWDKGFQWLLSMQSANGGWAAFDIDNDKEIWNRIPFADHKSMLDPPTSDITGRILEFLGGQGYRSDYPPAQGAIKFLENNQESDGSWYGRWGVNYLYGTWGALCGLKAIGYNMKGARIRQAADWLVSCQNQDGGWGESCLSYQDIRYKGKGKSTASQTSWALMGLMAAEKTQTGAVLNGIAFLLKTQNDKGSWDEEEFTGTGFPKSFYLRYHMYRDYFPLMTLARYHRAVTLERR